MKETLNLRVNTDHLIKAIESSIHLEDVIRNWPNKAEYEQAMSAIISNENVYIDYRVILSSLFHRNEEKVTQFITDQLGIGRIIEILGHEQVLKGIGKPAASAWLMDNPIPEKPSSEIDHDDDIPF